MLEVFVYVVKPSSGVVEVFSHTVESSSGVVEGFNHTLLRLSRDALVAGLDIRGLQALWTSSGSARFCSSATRRYGSGIWMKHDRLSND